MRALDVLAHCPLNKVLSIDAIRSPKLHRRDAVSKQHKDLLDQNGWWGVWRVDEKLESRQLEEVHKGA